MYARLYDKQKQGRVSVLFKKIDIAYTFLDRQCNPCIAQQTDGMVQ